MSIAFVVLKLEGGQIDPPQGVTGSSNSQGRIGLGLRGCLTSCKMLKYSIDYS